MKINMHENMKYENYMQNTSVVLSCSFIIWDSVYTEAFCVNDSFLVK